MNAEIISIADEILIGQIVNTNATFISQVLNNIGIHCVYIHTVRDNKNDILRAIDLALNRSDLIILTGGLGQQMMISQKKFYVIILMMT